MTHLRRARVNVFKLMGEKPDNVFGKWKDSVRFVGEIGGERGSKRLYSANPDDMGKVLALNIRRMPFDSAELVSEIKDARRAGMDGRASTLEKSEVEPIFKALMGELGPGNVIDRTGR